MSSKNFIQKIKRGIIFHILILSTFLPFLSSCDAMEEDETLRQDAGRSVKKSQPFSPSAEENHTSLPQSRIYSSLSGSSDGALHGNDPNKGEGQVEIISREEIGWAEESKEDSLNPMRSVSLDISRNDFSPYLISDEAKKEAENLYKQGLKCEEGGKIEDAISLYLASAKAGFVLSALHLNQIQLVKLIKIINEKQAFLDMKRSELTNQEGRNESLQTLLDLEGQILELNIEVSHIQEDCEKIKNLSRNGTTFSKNIICSYANNRNTFLWLDIDENDLRIKHFKSELSQVKDSDRIRRKMLSKLVNTKIQKLKKSISKLENIKRLLKTNEALTFINKVNKFIKSSLANLQKLGGDVEYPLLIKHDKILVNKILKIVRSYAVREYIVSPIVLEDIRQVRDALLTILVDHNFAFAGGDQLLFNFSSYFIAAHDIVEFPDALDCLITKLITLKEAERYLQGVENPQKYMQLTSPREYNRIKYYSPQQYNKKSLFQQHYDNRPPFPNLDLDLRLQVFLNNVRERANLYTLGLLNRSYQLYKEPYLREEAPLALYSLRKQLLGLGNSRIRVAEVSPWVPSLNYFLNLQANQPYEFIFDVGSLSIYIGTAPFKSSDGHCYLCHSVKACFPCGGSIKRIGDARFRTNEASGHYGWYWTDKRRLRFLEVLSIIGKRHKEFQVLHEPWMSDERRAEQYPSLSHKILHFLPFEEGEQLPKRDTTFQNMSNEDLQHYQDSFISRLIASFEAKPIQEDSAL